MKQIITTLAICSMFLSGIMLRAQNGEQLFNSNCGACHSIGKGKMTGPDLKKVAERHDEKWLISWIRSSQAMVKSGDQAAVKLFNDNSQITMPDQSLSDEEIRSVLTYIEKKGNEQPAVQASAAASPVIAVKENTGSMLNMLTFGEYLLVMMLVLMILVIWALAKALGALKSMSKESV